METTIENQKTKAKEIVFKRKRALSVQMLDLKPGESCFVEVTEHGHFVSEKYPDGIEKFEVIDLKTGEEKRMWVDGGLRGALSQVGGPEKAVGMKLEIKRGDQKPIEIINEDGKLEKVKVNTYEVFELA